AVLYCNMEIVQVQLVGKNRNGGREAGVVCLPCAITAIETGYITPLAFLKTGDRIVPRLFIEVQVRRIVLWAQQSLPYLHPAGLQIIRQTLALAGLSAAPTEVMHEKTQPAVDRELHRINAREDIQTGRAGAEYLGRQFLFEGIDNRPIH